MFCDGVISSDYRQGNIFLEVFMPLRYVGFYSEWKFELVNLFFLCEMSEDSIPTSVLETLKVSLEETEAHLCLGSSGAHNRIEWFSDLVKISEGSAKTFPILIVCQGSRHTIEKKTDHCASVLSKGFNILLVSPSMPQ